MLETVELSALTLLLVASTVPPPVTPFSTLIVQLVEAELATGPISATISPARPI